MPDVKTEASRRRRSDCADAALRAELARIGKTSVEERVKAALSMRERFAWLAAPPEPERPTSDARRREQP